MGRLWRRLLCRLGKHKRLNVIQSFGPAQHIGCPDCGRQFGIHHGVRGVVPWDADLADMYRGAGYDIEGPLSRWHSYRRALSEDGAGK